MSKYIVAKVLPGYLGSKYYDEIASFDTKKEALIGAISCMHMHVPAYVISSKSKMLTYILPRGSSSCIICGNQLDGKKHCKLCGAFHHYT